MLRRSGLSGGNRGHDARARPARRVVAAVGPAVLAPAGVLAGCAPAGAPSIAFFGAYFPSWLACALVGILGAVAVRLVFVRLGVDDVLPARLPVYVAIAAGIGFLVSLLSFGR
ncbi:YtcA family lipoprotein [Xanthobacter sp. V4C-4]|uniref:YtcA family lipoprotein n=1 Tax=Xanthobacter cornucopiae TaxID=3119924 RepID=UPI0037262F95